MSEYDATDEQWEGLAEVVPLRSGDAWPSWPEHRTLPAAPAAARRFVVTRVQCFGDARDVAGHLASRVPVLLDLTAADSEVARRILDFASGVVFGLDAAMHRVDRNVFLLSPSGTEVDRAGSGTA